MLTLIYQKPATRKIILVRLRSRRVSTSQLDPRKHKADHEHCVSLVQQRDKEGYLGGLLFPAHIKKNYFALRAFNVELASIKDGSNRRIGFNEEASLGQRLKFQWWREALNAIYDSDADDRSPLDSSSDRDGNSSTELSNISSSYRLNPIVRSLESAIQESNLTRRFVERLLHAREADLDIRQLPTVDNAIMYAEDSQSSLLYLTLECCGVRDDAADEVASSVGVGCGLVNAIRSTRFRALHGEMSIPAELLSRKISADYILARNDPDYRYDADNEAMLKEAVLHLAYQASKFLSRARKSQFDVPKRGRIAMISAIPAIHFLEKLKEVNYDLYDERLEPDRSRLTLLAMMGRTWLTGKF